jgi:lysylphosphatidylglycerol synthetase-like protein (DUF2156 family)
VEQFRLVLAIVAAVLHGTAFYLYTKQVKLGQSQPKIATWSISMFLMLLNALTFREMSKDGIATLQFFVGFVGASIVFLYALVRGKFSKPGILEWSATLLGISAAIVWYVFRDAAWANMIVLGALLVALTPTWEGVYRDPFTDAPRSWAMWASAYAITTVNILLNPNWHAVSLINPVVAMIAHGLVAVLSTEERKRQFSFAETR